MNAPLSADQRGEGFAYFAWHRLVYWNTSPGAPTRYWRWDQWRTMQLTGKFK